MSNAPLAGVKVIDFSIYVAAPSASSTLGAMGADVIKVEPYKGDPYRAGGHVFKMPAEDGLNPLYDTVNSYKRFISLDLRSEEGKEAMKKLIAGADIFVTNYRPQALAAIGIDYESAKKINPKIVYGQMNGYGFDGPEKDRAGYDSTAFMARSGFSFLGAYTRSAPMITPAGAGDVLAGLALLAGILGAYIKSKNTGNGELVTSTLYGSAIWSLASPLTRYQFMECNESWPGNPDFMALSADYQCKDGRWVRFCSMGAEKSWPPMCNALGLNEYVNDPRFCTSVEILKNTEACYSLIQSKVGEKTFDEWKPIFNENDLAFEKIYTPQEVTNDQQALVNGFFDEACYRDETVVKLPAMPFKFESGVVVERTLAPKVGGHSREILAEVGYTADQIEAMIERGIVRTAD